MADHISILDKDGNPVVLNSDDCGASGHAQGVKLLYSANGVATVIEADADGLKVKLGKGIAAEGAALGEGMLIQGDDGTDRQNVAVDTDGHVQADVLECALPTGAATQATLADCLTALQVLDNVIAGGETQVDVITSALPSGAATEATLASIKTACELIDNAVAGSEMQVDIVGALPAGTAAIGKLAANAGVNIGDVRIADNGLTRVRKRVALSASTTGGTVWDPASGKAFVLKKLVVSCGTGGMVQFFDGTDSGNTVIGPVLALADDGGWAENWDADFPCISAAANNILKYTTDSTFVGSVYVEGWEITP